MTDETTTIPGTEARVGDTVSRVLDGVTITGMVASTADDGYLITAEGGYIGHAADTYTLLHRPTPAPPTEPGSVILASEVRGVTFDPPVALRCDGDGWARLDEESIGGRYWHGPEHITAWVEAKIVAVSR